MVLTAEQIKENYGVLLSGIEKYVQGDRKDQFLDFYNQLDERIALLPASHKKSYHNCFPGGYVEHVIRVITAAFKISAVWQEMGTKDTYTNEELFVSALNHDLGKIGSLEHTSVFPSKDEWRKKNAKLKCYSILDSAVIHPNGDVPICQNLELKLGNIYENSLDEIFNSEASQATQKEYVHNCNQCWINFHRKYDIVMLRTLERFFPKSVIEFIYGKYQWSFDEKLTYKQYMKKFG